jgi:transposase ISL3 family protein
MNGHGQKLSRNMEQAILSLLTHPTLQAAAEHSGISESTLSRWMRLPVFQKRYRDARREMVNGAIVNLQQASTEAVSTLKSVMADTGSSASSKVAAARIIIELTLRSVEFEELEQRVLAIEEFQRTGVVPNTSGEVDRTRVSVSSQ